jgi:phosphohistidine phosphatase
MDIYLIRHAIAADLGENGIDNDEDRPLTQEGEAQAQQLGETLRQRGVEVDCMLTTPLVRARRTAEIMLDNWGTDAKPELIVEERIAPECKPRKLARVLRDLGRDRVAVVGHQPDLSTWAAWLIGSKKAYVDFAKGGAAHLVWEPEFKKGSGALIWLITPNWYGDAKIAGPRLVAATE